MLLLCELTGKQLQHLGPAKHLAIRMDGLQFILAEQNQLRFVHLTQLQRLVQVTFERKLMDEQLAAMHRVLALLVQKIELCEIDQTEVSQKLLHYLTILIGQFLGNLKMKKIKNFGYSNF